MSKELVSIRTHIESGGRYHIATWLVSDDFDTNLIQTSSLPSDCYTLLRGLLQLLSIWSLKASTQRYLIE